MLTQLRGGDAGRQQLWKQLNEQAQYFAGDGRPITAFPR